MPALKNLLETLKVKGFSGIIAGRSLMTDYSGKGGDFDSMTNDISVVGKEDFDPVMQLIYSAKQKAEYMVNTTVIELYWSIGRYVAEKSQRDGWGKTLSRNCHHIY